MTKFEDTPFITPDSVARAAGATQRSGRRVMQAMIHLGEISPVRTVTGRWNLTPAEARLFWGALHGRAIGN